MQRRRWARRMLASASQAGPRTVSEARAPVGGPMAAAAAGATASATLRVLGKDGSQAPAPKTRLSELKTSFRNNRLLVNKKNHRGMQDQGNK